MVTETDDALYSPTDPKHDSDRFGGNKTLSIEPFNDYLPNALLLLGERNDTTIDQHAVDEKTESQSLLSVLVGESGANILQSF